MNKIVDTRCLTVEVLQFQVESIDTKLSEEVLKELIKAVAMVIKEYKVSVSLNTIKARGTEILQDLLNAVESNKVKERVNKDGIVKIDFEKNVIKFIERPTCLDHIINANKDLGSKIVQVLQYIKKNYNTKQVNALYTYYSLSHNKQFCVELHNFAIMLYKLTGIETIREVIFAMHYEKHFEITTTMKRVSRYRSKIINNQFIYLGSVK
jgi:hypothetical protein